MPTIQIKQLEQKSKALAQLLDDPEACAQKLDDLLDFYAQRGKRKSQAAARSVALKRYDVPAVVLRQLSLDLGLQMQIKPDAGLAMLDILWAEGTLEHRQLAIRLLGQLPQEVFNKVRKRLLQWAEENREESLIKELGKRGTERMLLEDSAAHLGTAAALLKKRDFRSQAVALQALKAQIDRSPVVNLPEVFKLVAPVLQRPAKGLRPYLLDFYSSLVVHSPGEALYFLQKELEQNPTEETRWLTRQSLKQFPPEPQKALTRLLETSSRSQAS